MFKFYRFLRTKVCSNLSETPWGPKVFDIIKKCSNLDYPESSISTTNPPEISSWYLLMSKHIWSLYEWNLHSGCSKYPIVHHALAISRYIGHNYDYMSIFKLSSPAQRGGNCLKQEFISHYWGTTKRLSWNFVQQTELNLNEQSLNRPAYTVIGCTFMPRLSSRVTTYTWQPQTRVLSL